jgi:hypothetical protein
MDAILRKLLLATAAVALVTGPALADDDDDDRGRGKGKQIELRNPAGLVDMDDMDLPTGDQQIVLNGQLNAAAVDATQTLNVTGGAVSGAVDATTAAIANSLNVESRVAPVTNVASVQVNTAEVSATLDATVSQEAAIESSELTSAALGNSLNGTFDSASVSRTLTGQLNEAQVGAEATVDLTDATAGTVDATTAAIGNSANITIGFAD